MRLLAPLGLLGLISIIILILIYILKPNYQQKFVSSTYVWKLSLKYRKKKIPTSKLRNILIIICQVFILAACSAILSKPAMVVKEIESAPEVVAIIDASASMRAESMDETRYERAVLKTVQLVDKTFAENGTVSVVIADNKAEFFAERTNADGKAVLKRKLNALIEDADEGIIDCSYSTSDVEGAVELCEKILKDNPKTKIYFYTDATYAYVPKGVEIVSVAEESEWNAAILNAYTVRVDGYYQFYIDVACYNQDKPVQVNVTVANANAADATSATKSVYFDAKIDCVRDETKRVVFMASNQFDDLTSLLDLPSGYLDEEMEYEKNGVKYVRIEKKEDWIFSYKSVTVQLYENDSFRLDNNFEIYDGQREVIKIQYASAYPNPFFQSVLDNLTNVYASSYELQVHEVKKGEEFKVEEFDFYIFEHVMPTTLPKDGISMLVNPDIAPENSGIASLTGSPISLDGIDEEQRRLVADSKHPTLMAGLTPSNVVISQYKKLVLDDTYETLWSFGGNPILAARNDGVHKTVVLSFSVHYSNLVVTKEFPMMMYNLFQFYYPRTVNGNAFEVNEKVQLQAREDWLTVSHDSSSFNQTFTEFPAVLEVDAPGRYTLTQKDVYSQSNNLVEHIYVTIPATESNICYAGEAFPEPYNKVDEEDYFDDLLLYIAAALVAVLFIEWWLQSRDAM